VNKQFPFQKSTANTVNTVDLPNTFSSYMCSSGKCPKISRFGILQNTKPQIHQERPQSISILRHKVCNSIFIPTDIIWSIKNCNSRTHLLCVCLDPLPDIVFARSLACIVELDSGIRDVTSECCTVTHCNTLQHTVTRYRTLQHAAPH